MDRYNIIRLDNTESTNTYAKSLKPENNDLTPTVVYTDCQTCGRGQRGNTWESERGKNLTFSLVLYPSWLSAAHQFELSMLVSIGIVNALRNHVVDHSRLKIKWPNDIYYDDKKVAGILIENSLSGQSIERSIVGIGLNVNQKEFVSDAPNPVSLYNITGSETSLDEILDNVVGNILDMVEQYEYDPEVDELVYLYNNMLWRNDGREHLWRKEFEAKVDRVGADGRLYLTDKDGNEQSFLFKEISAVL